MIQSSICELTSAHHANIYLLIDCQVGPLGHDASAIGPL